MLAAAGWYWTNHTIERTNSGSLLGTISGRGRWLVVSDLAFDSAADAARTIHIHGNRLGSDATWPTHKIETCRGIEDELLNRALSVPNHIDALKHAPVLIRNDDLIATGRPEAHMVLSTRCCPSAAEQTDRLFRGAVDDTEMT